MECICQRALHILGDPLPPLPPPPTPHLLGLSRGERCKKNCKELSMHFRCSLLPRTSSWGKVKLTKETLLLIILERVGFVEKLKSKQKGAEYPIQPKLMKSAVCCCCWWFCCCWCCCCCCFLFCLFVIVVVVVVCLFVWLISLFLYCCWFCCCCCCCLCACV